MKVSNIFNTLKPIFWKTETFFEKLDYLFLAETTKIENTSSPFKTAQRPMLREIEWRLQNGPITKSGFLPVTSFICSSFRTS